ncbi:hypothetical protein [Geotoga petraea]|uniref:Uncharacterized protein n=1 Tax=Geotoga petraea TaxID=28234 RepID=A0A4Z0W0X1_9BACT|nr:hypothetical protein [Geotoga petraea]TGG88723.1 hypothetical protein E4650_00540 [Geotoga petraea]
MKKLLVFLFVISLFSLVFSIEALLSDIVHWNLPNNYKKIEINQQNMLGNIKIQDDIYKIKIMNPFSNPYLWIDYNSNNIKDSNELYMNPIKDSFENIFTYKFNIYPLTTTSKDIPKITILLSLKGKQNLMELYYSYSSHKTGYINFKNELIKTALFTQRADGIYNLDSTLSYGIDLNKNGLIDLTPDKKEIFNYDDVFKYKNEFFSINNVDNFGRTYEIIETNKPKKFYSSFSTGDKIFEINKEDIIGKTLNTSNINNKVITIVYSDINFDVIQSCEKCNSRIKYIYQWFENEDLKDLIMIFVYTGEEEIQVPEKTNENLYLFNDEDLIDMYGSKNDDRILIFDKNKTLKYMDYYWVEYDSLESDIPQNGKWEMSLEDYKNMVRNLMY